MKYIEKELYEQYDRSEITNLLFHPRKDHQRPENAIEIPVSDDVLIGAKEFIVDTTGPAILFFHGNGEIVSDYDDIGEIYNKMGINFFPVDYRGYGLSTGSPTVSTMIDDAHYVFHYFVKWLDDKSISGPKIVMGRSLGSASAIEIASQYASSFDGLIIESGFSLAFPVLYTLGIPVSRLNLKDEKGLSNVVKIKKYNKPLLLIHAENDHLLPYSNAEDLFETCSTEKKTLTKIPKADHNTIFYYGLEEYMQSVAQFIQLLK